MTSRQSPVHHSRVAAGDAPFAQEPGSRRHLAGSRRRGGAGSRGRARREGSRARAPTFTFIEESDRRHVAEVRGRRRTRHQVEGQARRRGQVGDRRHPPALGRRLPGRRGLLPAEIRVSGLPRLDRGREFVSDGDIVSGCASRARRAEPASRPPGAGTTIPSSARASSTVSG